MLYLMIKTHNITGKKYLCKKKTTSDELAIKYCGSGLIWKRHLKIHGKDLSTVILFKCEDNETDLFRKEGIKHSLELKILEPPFLNLILEQGHGGSIVGENGTKNKKWIYKDNERTVVSKDELEVYLKDGWILGFPPQVKQAMSEKLKGKPTWNKGLKLKQDNEYVSKKSKKIYKIISNKKLSTEERSNISKEFLNRPEVKAKFEIPRKPPITAINLITNEILTLSRKEWKLQHNVYSKRLIHGGTSNNWEMIML